jgi:type II secretory pathway predicted ATPase ExeA
LTYEPHFGLREKPFSLSPNPRFFLRISSHGQAFDALIAGIRRREGILALTGEVGTGKTTLCRAVVESLDRKTFAAFVPDPILSREDLLKTLLVDFGVVSIDEIKAGRLRESSRTELGYVLYEFLTSLQPLNAFAVVMIDEAQNLPTTLLEEIRILCDMENGEKVLQLLLIGQPELQATLSTPEMRQVRQRLSVRCQLDPLAHADVAPYIAHRLGLAGCSKPIFEEAAIPPIYAASGGIPRVINLLCDRALFKAAAAAASTVTAKHVGGAADDLWIPRAGSASSLRDGTPASFAAVDQGDESKRIGDYLKKTSDVAPRPRTPRQGLPSTYQMRHDAHYVDELESRRQRGIFETVHDDSPVSTPLMTAGDRLKPLAKFAAVAAAALVLSAIGVWLLRLSADAVSEPPSAQQADHSTASLLGDVPAPIAAPESPISTTRPASPAAPPSAAARSPAAAPKFAVQMATFRTKARATESVRELEAAGYEAFSDEVWLRDGARAFAVFLGPYSERTAADGDLERAQLTPGYGIGRVIQIDLTSSSNYLDTSR